ncbi:MAG: tRNA (adenosine(37)-N6)-threonylcarbamoyltransferase complex ATPase subunit type 1 TsaE [Niabella sp.]
MSKFSVFARPALYLCRMEKIFAEAEIADVAAWLWPQVSARKVVALHGQMGAGKTTLVCALGQFLHFNDTVSSPTFSIINEYNFEESGHSAIMYHIDLYRLKDAAEAVTAGVEDCLYSGEYCMVEWPERAPNLFPDDTLHVYLSLTDDGKRRIKIEG